MKLSGQSPDLTIWKNKLHSDIPEEQEAIEAPSGNLQNGAMESLDGRASTFYFFPI